MKQLRFVAVFLAGMTTVVSGLEARAHCDPQPNIAGELKLQTCEYKTSATRINELPDADNLQSKKGEKEFVRLDPSRHGVLLKGKLSKKIFLSDKASEKYPEKLQEKMSSFKKLPETIEITTFYKTKDKNFCKKNPAGTTFNMDFIFVCCDTPSGLPPCGVDSHHYSEKLTKIPSQK